MLPAVARRDVSDSPSSLSVKAIPAGSLVSGPPPALDS